jgi:hypothetical protein
MPITVTVEDGTSKADANSYASVAEADTYFATRPRSSGWSDLTADEKAQHLIYGTRILDHAIEWMGLPSSYAQALAWPRYLSQYRHPLPGPGVIETEYPSLDGSSIDPWLKTALFELAMNLIASDLTEEPALRGIRRLNVGNGAIEIEADTSREARQVPRWVLDIVAPYGAAKQGSGTVKITRA